MLARLQPLTQLWLMEMVSSWGQERLAEPRRRHVPWAHARPWARASTCPFRGQLIERGKAAPSSRSVSTARV